MEIWQWVSSVLGVAGFLMASRMLLGEILGRPALSLSFETTTLGNIKILRCALYNSPITNTVLRWLRISRMTADQVMGDYHVSEVGTGRVLLSLVRVAWRTETVETGHLRISVPSSPFPVFMNIAVKKLGDQACEVISNDTTDDNVGTIKLDRGEYKVVVGVISGQRTRLNAEARLVNSGEDFGTFYWAKE